MKTLIKNVHLLNETVPVHLLIEDGILQGIGKDFVKETDTQVIEGHGALVSPGFVDLHVHLREPGFTYKETIKTGSLAAAKGGFTTICAMPNLNPVPDTKELFQELMKKNQTEGAVRIFQYAPITENLRSETISPMKELKDAGALGFTNDGVGVQTAGTMYLGMKEAARLNLPLIAHTEDDSLLFGGVMHEGIKNKELNLPGILGVAESSQIARDLLLAEATGVHYHVCHLSTKESVRVIRDAKKAGIHVTCEVTPHHLLMNEEDILNDHGYFKMNPPLRGKEDQEALIEGLIDGTIDCIATDHAPHGYEEKNQSMLKAPFGITGSETAFSLLYTELVKKGRLSLEQLLNALTVKPAEIFNLPYGKLRVGQPCDLTLLQLEQEEIIEEKDYVSMGVNTPFTGRKVFGNPILTMVAGKIVYEKKVEK